MAVGKRPVARLEADRPWLGEGPRGWNEIQTCIEAKNAKAQG
jgi:hypothetical protein